MVFRIAFRLRAHLRDLSPLSPPGALRSKKGRLARPFRFYFRLTSALMRTRCIVLRDARGIARVLRLLSGVFRAGIAVGVECGARCRCRMARRVRRAGAAAGLLRLTRHRGAMHRAGGRGRRVWCVRVPLVGIACTPPALAAEMPMPASRHDARMVVRIRMIFLLCTNRNAALLAQHYMCASHAKGLVFNGVDCNGHRAFIESRSRSPRGCTDNRSIPHALR